MSHGDAGLYVHVPFCRRVCPYCDFAVRTGDAKRRSRYVDHLVLEAGLYRDYPLTFDTIYLGGGTPSALDAEDLARIIETLRAGLRFAEPLRIYLEANPEDVTREAVEAWVSAGVRVVSLGIQSFDPAQLAFLGRMHSADEARRSVERVLAGGIETVSIDLIFGLPGQTVGQWRRQLDQAAGLAVHHLSCYQLTIHSGTRFGLLEKRGRLQPSPEDTQADMFHLTHRHLPELGYAGYEVSNFAATPGHRSLHNMKYWDHTPYLGLGPSAHSYVDRRRWWNLRRTDPWQESAACGRRPIESEESLDPRALALESLMIGLRTYAGLDLEQIEQRWGVPLREPNRQLLERLAEDGWLRVNGSRIVPTVAGLAVADSLATEFTV